MATTEVFMSNRQYTDEFKAEAVKQVTERGFRVADVAQRLGVSTHSLYEWLRKAKSAANADGAEAALLPTAKDSAEVRRLKAEIKRLTEERDILKMSAVKDFRFASDGRKPISDAGLEGIRVPGSYGPHPCQELHGSLGIVLPGDLRRAPAHRR